MNWYKLFLRGLMFLITWTALLMGTCAYAAKQHGNTSAMYIMLTCVGLCIVMFVGLFREAIDD